VEFKDVEFLDVVKARRRWRCAAAAAAAASASGVCVTVF